MNEVLAHLTGGRKNWAFSSTCWAIHISWSNAVCVSGC